MKTIEQKYNPWIVILSIAIPLVVVVLFNIKLTDFGFNVKPLTFLPPIYATINAITAILLVAAVWAIKNKNRKLHETLMKFAIACSVLFLAMYVAYHMTSLSVKFGDSNHNGILEETEKMLVANLRYVYYFILLTHISLSVIVIPLVLVSYVRALAQKFDKHKQITKFTFPIWLYVAVTGVIVYLMISPYYLNIA